MDQRSACDVLATGSSCGEYVIERAFVEK